MTATLAVQCLYQDNSVPLKHGKRFKTHLKHIQEGKTPMPTVNGCIVYFLMELINSEVMTDVSHMIMTETVPTVSVTEPTGTQLSEVTTDIMVMVHVS